MLRKIKRNLGSLIRKNKMDSEMESKTREFFSWLYELREKGYYEVAHLAPVATINKDKSINLAVKGIGVYEKDNKPFLTTLEMYGTKTYQNILINKRCSLIFTDPKTGISYQVDCTVEVHGRGTEFYDMRAKKHGSFHGKTNAICAYLMKVEKVLDKRPK